MALGNMALACCRKSGWGLGWALDERSSAMTGHRAILIAGPTASGKSALAIRLAQQHHGMVINADSMQVYRDLQVLTARPSGEDLKIVRHALYGHVGGDTPYSVARWLDDVQEAVEECRQHGFMPIITGGTGLYFKALLEGLSPIPPVPEPIRTHWRGAAHVLGPRALHALLAARDPGTAARLAPTDPQRLTRALEVLEATGRGLSDWQRQRAVPLLPADDALRLVAMPDRAELLARADARFDAMMAGGALEEVRALAGRGYAENLPVMRALGVRPLMAAIRSEVALGQAVAQAKLDTRRYIKRQLTWLRRNMMSWNIIKMK